VKEHAIYAEPEQRSKALHLGMWLFLGSETLLFAGLFGLYSAYRAMYAHDFAVGVSHDDLFVGTTNTGILIVSSFFVAWSIHMLRGGRRRLCIASIAVAMLLGACFLALKAYEYSEHLREGVAPGAYYHSSELPSHGSQIFFTLYYLMTGLHALHVIAGITILGWLAIRVGRRRITPADPTVLELGGLYWHLVDIVWLFLWPLLYLIH
jgi:cytochrome c oxidase subunit III